MLTANEFEKLNQGTYERMVKELAWDLASMVESGDISTEEANEWLVAKQEQWMGGDR